MYPEKFAHRHDAHEIHIGPGPTSMRIQEQVDEYIKNTAAILGNPDIVIDKIEEDTLRLGLAIMEYYRHSLDELDYYRKKFNKVEPDDLEMSQLRDCYIGKCKCGQLLIEDKDRCCPKCNQFIKWPPSRKHR